MVIHLVVFARWCPLIDAHAKVTLRSGIATFYTMRSQSMLAVTGTKAAAYTLVSY
jgi:hypothetical protein